MDKHFKYIAISPGSVNVKLSRLLRDTANWFHVTVAVDTTIASPAEDRVKIYVNGERQTEFDAAGGGNPIQLKITPLS